VESVLTCSQLLQQLHNRLTRQLSPAAAIDPFTVLPKELAEMVLEYLSFRHMVNCIRVSKGWRDYLSKLPRLWMHLDLSGARKPVPRSFVNVAFKRSEHRMNRVTVHRFEHMDVLNNLAKAAKQLTELEIISLPHAMSATLVEIVRSAPGLTKLILHPEVTLDTAERIMGTRPTLKHVSFNAVKSSTRTADWTCPFENLTTLDLHFSEPISGIVINIRALFRQSPSLKSLSLSNIGGGTAASWPADMSELPPLTSLTLKRIVVDGHQWYPDFPPTLQRLVVDHDCHHDMQRSSPTQSLLSSRLPELTHLTLANCGWTAERLEQLLDLYLDDAKTVRSLEGAKALTQLSIHGLARSDQGGSFFNGPDSLFGRSPRILTKALETLDVATLAVDDDDIEHLLTYDVVGLQSIDLSHTNVTGASIKMLADKLPGLKTIKADNCSKINGRDAIHYAQRKGIAVSCQMGEPKGGKRIRY
jgi:F-box/TPR repeat protein Pof3